MTRHNRKSPTEILDTIMPLRHFFLLENLMKQFYLSGKKPVLGQTLVDSLVGKEPWIFWKDAEGKWNSPQLEEDIEYLHARGYAYMESNKSNWPIYPTPIGESAYRQVYGTDPRKVDWEERDVRMLSD